MSTDAKQGSGGLVEALRAPLERGDLDAALEQVRRAQLRAPGDDTIARAVVALELLTSQVWYGGQEGSEPMDGSPFGHAAASLGDGDLDAALSEYRGTAARDRDQGRAERLAHAVEVVLAAAEGVGLPDRESSSPEAVGVPLPKAERPTKVGAKSAQPRGAVTLEDIVVVDEVEGEDGDPTVTEVSEPSVELRFDDNSRATKAGLRETTRVAKDGELPLDQLRELMQSEGGVRREDSDAALDGFLDELEQTDGSGSRQGDPPTELEIEVEVDVDLDDGLGQPAARTPSKTFRRPSVAELEEAEEQVLTPPPFRSDPPPPPSGPPARPPSSPPIPRREELSGDPIHAPLDTGDLELPEHPRYDVTEDDLVTTGVMGQDPTISWTGVPLYEEEPATFEPGDVPSGEDRWDAPMRSGPSIKAREREAEALVARGELEQALKIYETLAAQSPDEARLWRRIKAIAWMLQRDSDPTET